MTWVMLFRVPNRPLPFIWRALRRINGSGSTPKKSAGEGVRKVQNRLLEPPSREDVVQAYRLILGREPEDQKAIDSHLNVPTVAELRRVLLNSNEFQGKYKVMHPLTRDHPDLSVRRDTLVFIHLEKTGGTSLRTMLEGQFPMDRICPVRDNNLHLLSAAELGRYDFFAGHFDRSSLRFIPRDNIKTVALFRDPRSRLISFYRFLRSHPVGDEFAGDALIRLASNLTAEEFFERPEARCYPVVNNHYLAALGTSFSGFSQHRASQSEQDISSALAEAKRQICALTALGITERFKQSVEVIFRTLNQGSPPPIETVHVTNNLPDLDARFHRVDQVPITPRLNAALHDLTLYDDELYQFAIAEFDRRWGAIIGATGNWHN